MKYITIAVLGLILASCGPVGPSYRLKQRFVAACVNHGGIENITDKGYRVYVCHCKDGYSIKGIDQ